jgi:hypothetical protein
MEFYKIEIINPKAKKLIKNLAAMDLIRIKKDNSNSEFIQVLSRLRKDSENAPSLEEISQEVELIRKARHEK